jgi:hypothetical protein
MEEQTLEAVNARFNEELQRQIDGRLPKGHVYRLGNPSEALLSSLNNLPIEMAASTLELKSSNKNLHEHPFNLKEVTNLTQAIQQPIAVFESETNPNRTVILTELKDNRGHNFIATIDIYKKGNVNIIGTVNSVISLYSKDSNVRIGRWFLGKQDKAVGRDLLKWVDTEKAFTWLSDHSSDTSAAGLPSKGIVKVVQNFQNPKLPERKS